MALSTFCDGDLEIEFQNQQEQDAFEYLRDYYGDVDSAWTKFYEMFRSNKDEQFRETSATHVIEGFTAQQQNSIVGSMLNVAYNKALSNKKLHTNGRPNMGRVQSYIRSVFEGARSRAIENGNSFQANELQKILDNFDEFWSMTHQRFKRLGLQTNENGEAIDTSGGSFTDYDWTGKDRLFIDPKDTTSTKIKLALSFIPKVRFQRDNNGQLIEGEYGLPKVERFRNYLNMPEFASMDSLYDQISEILSDYIPPQEVDNKFDAYLNHLATVGAKNPQMVEVVRHLRNMDIDTSFKSDFVNAFGKTYANHNMTLMIPQYDMRGNEVGWELRVLDSNRTSQKETIKEQWYENQKLLPIVQLDEENDLVINQSEVADIKKNYIEGVQNYLNRGGNINDDKVVQIVQETLSKLGIQMPQEAVEYVRDNPKAVQSKTSTWAANVAPDRFDQKGFLPIIFDIFESDSDVSESDIEEFGKLGTNNPIYGRDSQGVVNRLASITARHTDRVYAPSYQNINNDTIHAIQDHTSLTREFARIKNNPDDAIVERGAYDRRSRILQAISENKSNIRNVLGVTYFDGLRRSNRSQGSEYEDMSTSEKEVTRLSLHQNPQKNGRQMFLAPTLSDKSRSYVISLPQVTDLYDESDLLGDTSSISEDGSLELGWNSPAVYVMYDMVRSEMSRIRNIQSMIDEGMKPEDFPLGEDYMNDGQRFYFFPSLNPENTPEIWNREVINGEEVYKLKDLDNNSDARRVAREQLATDLESAVQNTRNRWRELGIVPDVNNMNSWNMDRGYLREEIPFQVRDTQRKLTYAALDYQVGQRFFMSEMTKILSGDPALHNKGTVNDTLINLQKRFANHIAPAIMHNAGTEVHDQDLSTVNIATINDRIIDSQHIEEYEKLFADQLDNEDFADAYRGIESTDAQEYVTLKEHLRMQLLYGKIGEDLYNKIINRINEVNETDQKQFKLSSFLTEKEMQHVFMPHKPVYVGRKYYKHIDTTNWIYRKTSAIPLIPEMTRGTPLDNLRRAMEEKGVDRVAYQTADKIGAYNPQDVFEEADEQKRFQSASDIADKLITEDELTDDMTMNDITVQTVNRNDLGLQMEIPKKDSRRLNKIMSQMDKLFTQGIKNEDGFLLPWEDNPVSGKELEVQKQDRRREMYDIARENLFNELDAEVTTDEDGNRQVIFRNKQQLENLLLDEAERRDWSPSAQDALKLDDDGDFTIPLSFVPDAGKAESLLLSLITNRVVEQSMPGKGYVQVSNAGWQDIGNGTNVAVTENYDPETGLKHARVEDGEVQPAQVLVTWDFKDENGNVLPMDEYTKTTEDGRTVIDNSKLDDQLREIVGARIPTQGASSMLPIEIVGFLPYNMQKTMVVTDEIVPQMGSDFDVDKVYAYMDDYDYDPKSGELTRAEDLDRMDELKQEYKDIIWSSLTNPDTLARVLKPLDMDYLENEADRIQNLRDPSDNIKDFLDPHSQIDDHSSQQAGKDLIGNTSLASNFNSMLEMYPQKMTAVNPSQDGADRIRRSVLVEGEDTYTVDQVGGTGATTTAPDGSTITTGDMIMMAQNGAVDNAKKLILDKLHITSNTVNTVMTTMMMNDGSNAIPLEQITGFFGQEIIQLYHEELENLRGQLNDEYMEDFEDAARQRAIERLTENLSEENKEWVINQVNQYKRNLAQREGQVDAAIPRVQELNKNLEKTGARGDRQYIADQLKYLDAFMNLKNISDSLWNIHGVMNWGDRNGAGKSLLHSKSKLDDYNAVSDNDVFADAEDTVNNNQWESAADNSFKLAWETFHPFFHYHSDVFQAVQSELGTINPDDALDIFREMKSFVFTQPEMYENAEAERHRLLFGDENVEDIATRVKNAQEEWGNQDFFIQRLRPQVPTTEDDAGTVLFSADKGERLDDIRLIRSLGHLLTEKDAEKRLLAEDLVKYSYLVGGGVTSPTSFASYIPIEYAKQEGVKNAVDNFPFNDSNAISQRFREQYLQHNPSEASVLQQDVYEQTPEPVIRNSKDREGFFRETPGGGIEGIPYVSYYDRNAGKWRLWKFDEENTHYEIDTLGKANSDGYNIHEYNARVDKTVNKSVIESNRTRLKDDPSLNEDPVLQKSFDGTTPDLVELKNESPQGTFNSEQFYDSVLQHEEDPYVVKLTKFMQEIDTDFRVSFRSPTFFEKQTGDARTEGHYHPNKHGRGTLLINNNLQDRTKIHQTILHELLHKQTWEISQRNAENRSRKQNNLVRRMNNLMKYAMENSNPTDAMREALMVDGEVSLHEFMAYAFSTPRGQEWLNGIQIEEESLLDRFIRVFQDLIRDLGQSLGLEVNRESALAHTINNTLNLLQETKRVREKGLANNPKNVSQSERRKENEDDYEFVPDPVFDGLRDDIKKAKGGKDVELNDEQKSVYNEVIEFLESNNTGKQYYTVQGKAGTGKTFTIAEIIDYIYKTREGNPQVAISAVTHKAINVLEDKVNTDKPDGVTVASLLGKRLNMETGEFVQDENSNPAIFNYDTIFIDEASMIGKDTLNNLLDMSRSRDIVFIGDPGQLPPIGDESGNQSPVFDNDRIGKLEERVRQGEGNPILDLSDKYWMKDNLPKDLDRVNVKGTFGTVKFLRQSEALDQTKEQFARAVENQNVNAIKAITYRNKTRRMVNREIRAFLFDNPSKQYQKGDIIVSNGQYRSESAEIYNGDDFIVLENRGVSKKSLSTISTGNYDVTQKIIDGFREIGMDPNALKFYTLRVKRGDGSRMTIPVPTDATKKKLNRYLQYAKRQNDGFTWKSYYTFRESLVDIDYGYAITSHKSQGSTYETSVVFEDDIKSVSPISEQEKAKSLYTAITRASDEVIMVSRDNPKDPDTRTESTDKVNEAQEKVNELLGFDQQSLGQTVGEFRRSLSNEQKKVFDQLRNRIQTKC